MNLDNLREHIAMPDWEKRLLPLFLFKGTRPHRIRALWNVVYAMYLEEAPTYFEAKRIIVPDGDHGKLCGLVRPPTDQGIRGIFSRLRGCKNLTDSVSKSFTEYVEYIHPWPCIYERVPFQSKDSHRDRVAWWRDPRGPTAKRYKHPTIKSEDRCYPFLLSNTPEQKLVSQVYSMVPTSIPYEIRGDLCQDLIVALLCGETTIDSLPRDLLKYATKARKFMPDRWRNVSIDDVSPGTDNLRLIDVLADESEPYDEEEVVL